jgi:type II secretory pathway component PulM
MNTRTDTWYLLRRIATRAGAGVWRQRGTVLAGAAIVAVLVGYVVINGPAGASRALAQAAPTTATTDCANTVMTAIESPSAIAGQQAYQCTAPRLQQSVSESAFRQQLQSLRVPNATSIHRLGTYQAPSGGTLVFYAVDSTHAGSVGYVVSLGTDGKVVNIN